MRFLVLCLCAIACSSPAPAHRPHRKQAPPPPDIVATDDRAHPQRLQLAPTKERFDGTSVDAHAPRAGTWWYVVEVEPLQGKLTRLRFSASFDGPEGPRHLSLTYVDERGEHPARNERKYTELELPESPNPPSTFLLRITTTTPGSFSLHVNRVTSDVPPPPLAPCDRDHIDPSNPNCKGVHPRCDLNHPDFTNPSCCNARCEFGRLACRSKIVSGDSRWAMISLGVKDEIMKYAKGRLFQVFERQQKVVSEVVVWEVGEHESRIQILEPKRVDAAKLLENGFVILSPPETCLRRRRKVLP